MRAQLFRLWFPAVAWAAVILCFSSGTASAGNTGSFLRDWLRFLTDEQFAMAHFLIRKSAHLVEYAILGALNYRAVRGGREGWGRRWAWIAVALAAGVAILDETLQALSPARKGAAGDMLLDTLGAAAAQLLWRVRYPVRQ